MTKADDLRVNIATGTVFLASPLTVIRSIRKVLTGGVVRFHSLSPLTLELASNPIDA